MDNKLQTNKSQALEVAYKPNLINAMVAGNRMDINIALREFKTDGGAVNFPAILSIPRDNRLPELAKKDFKQMIGIITAALTLAFEGMNLKRAMNPSQIIDLAEVVIDTSSEDNLALEDLMLFLQKLVRGEYGVMYESMDIPKFMESFERYRQDRYESLRAIRDNVHLEAKGLGNGERSVVKDALDEHFFSMANKLVEMNQQLRETRKENHNLKKNIK